MTTVRCPECSANLRVNPERMGTRTSAKCPRCQAQVSLAPTQAPAQAGPVILVACEACGARLKAPAARAGTRSVCPKCHAQILIQPAAPRAAAVSAAAGTEHEESSSAATRRIDSRMLGMFEDREAPAQSGGVDLDTFVRPPASSPPPMSPASASPDSGSEPSLAASLMKPPVAEMGKIAREIRDTAERLTEPAGAGKTYPRPTLATEPKVPSAIARTEQAQVKARAYEELLKSRDPAGSAAPIRRGSLSAGRGLISGLVAGLLVGGASAGAAALIPDAAPVLARMPFSAELVGLSQTALRILLPMLLGAVAGFVAGALHSAGAPERPAPVVRCAGMGVLMGAACGLVGGLATGAGMQIWPLANWMRDLLLVGLLTPAVNRIFPSSRS